MRLNKAGQPSAATRAPAAAAADAAKAKTANRQRRRRRPREGGIAALFPFESSDRRSPAARCERGAPRWAGGVASVPPWVSLQHVRTCPTLHVLMVGHMDYQLQRSTPAHPWMEGAAGPPGGLTVAHITAPLPAHSTPSWRCSALSARVCRQPHRRPRNVRTHNACTGNQASKQRDVR